MQQGKAGHVQESPSASDMAGFPILILACGNDLRQDDGAGLALARRMTQLAPAGTVECIYVHQLMPELAVAIARPGVQTVLFVDTRAVPPEDTTAGLEITRLAADPADPKLGHHVDARMVLLYARELYAAQVSAWSITIPGWAFGHGEGFSPRVHALLAGADGFVAFAFSCVQAVEIR